MKDTFPSGVPIYDVPATFHNSRISLPAIFAGVALTFVILFLLSMLGQAIGLREADFAESDPLSSLGLAAVVWWAVTTIVSLFIGGWATGLLSGILSSMERTVNGLSMWAIYSLISIFIMSTSIGTLISKTGSTIQRCVVSQPAITQKMNSVLKKDTIKGIDKTTGDAAGISPIESNVVSDTAESESRAARYIFFSLLMGAISASIGSWAGRVEASEGLAEDESNPELLQLNGLKVHPKR